MAKVFAVLLLLFTVACGTPAAKQNSTSSGGTTPPSSLPQVAGAWNGAMAFTDSTGGLTGSLTFNLTEDSSGDLAGNAMSTPPYCEFTLAMSGKVYSNNTFFVETADYTTAAFAGSLSNGNKTVSGNVNLGSGTGCGPRNGGTFSAQLQ